MKLKLPIIIDENGDISVYSSREEAQVNLEPVDVLNNEYLAYDADGHLLQLVVIKKKGILFSREMVEINYPDISVDHADELVEKLKNYLEKTGNIVNEGSELNLSQLVTKVEKYLA